MKKLLTIMGFYLVMTLVLMVIGYTTASKDDKFTWTFLGAFLGVVISIALYFLFGKKYIGA